MYVCVCVLGSYQFMYREGFPVALAIRFFAPAKKPMMIIVFAVIVVIVFAGVCFRRLT